MMPRIWVLLFLALAGCASRERVEFSDDELASESVLPVFEEPEAVKGRNIMVGEKTELMLAGGADLNAPFYGNIVFGGSLGYNFNEEQAVLVSFNYWLKKDSAFKTQIEAEGLAVLEGAP